MSWLKLLTKLTVKTAVKEKHSISRAIDLANTLRKLDKFLLEKGYCQPYLLTDTILWEFVSQFTDINGCQSIIKYAVNIWKEEQWLIVSFTPRKYKRTQPKIETISEELLYQIYKNLELFPPLLERLFRLQLVLGCRIGELIRMPRQCLKKEGDKWFLLRWIAKRKRWQFFQIHPLVAELVREQQKFIDAEFGSDSNFDKLFCKISASRNDGVTGGGRCEGRFTVKPIYLSQVITHKIISKWIEDFSHLADLRDKDGKKFKLTSHMFRRTKASIMAYCEAEDEYIAAVLGHSSLDMLPHYRKRSLERLEKEADTKGYVDMYGRLTSFKPKKRRYQRLAELLKVSTPLGECHRPTMLGDCQYRYACLSCDHHRVMLEDKPKIKADIKSLEKDLEQAKATEKERRVTEINRLLDLLKTRLQGLKKLQNIKGKKVNGS